jgi:hypothetical protein
MRPCMIHSSLIAPIAEMFADDFCLSIQQWSSGGEKSSIGDRTGNHSRNG